MLLPPGGNQPELLKPTDPGALLAFPGSPVAPEASQVGFVRVQTMDDQLTMETYGTSSLKDRAAGVRVLERN